MAKAGKSGATVCHLAPLFVLSALIHIKFKYSNHKKLTKISAIFENFDNFKPITCVNNYVWEEIMSFINFSVMITSDEVLNV